MILGSAIQWGNVSGWVAGVATSIAVIVALATTIRGERSLRNSEMSAIFAWPLKHHGTLNWTLVLANNTHYPISSWRVVLAWDGAQDAVGSDELGIVLPGQFEYPWIPLTPEPKSETEVKVRLEFIDALGRRNVRLPGGGLEVKRSRGSS
jgi:hypothetical protein